MSPRAPKIDNYDDEDDQDGILQDELAKENDLTLHVKDAAELGLGGAPETAERNSRLQDLREEDLEEEDRG